MATRGTLASAKFKALLGSLVGQAEFILQPCDGLAEAIERIVESGDATKTEALCTQYTRAMGTFGLKTGQMDTLVLGCTHYPFAAEALRTLLGPDVQIMANGEAVARQTRRLVQTAVHQAQPATGQVTLFSTGQPQGLQAAAGRWLGLPTPANLLHF